MQNTRVIRAIIPALNEEKSIGKVIRDFIPGLVNEIIVVDNGSKDNTRLIAEQAGATVLTENRRGYGNACLKGIHYITNQEPATDIIVFIDADYSDYPQEMSAVIDPILNGTADLVIGSRVLGNRQGGSMTIPQVFGNWLATTLIRWIYKGGFTDLGPFRAITYEGLKQLEMQDGTYGWTVEMQVKAVKGGLKCTEVPVSYRRRIGKSKVSGTIKGVIMAGYKILWTIIKLS